MDDLPDCLEEWGKQNFGIDDVLSDFGCETLLDDPLLGGAEDGSDLWADLGSVVKCELDSVGSVPAGAFEMDDSGVLECSASQPTAEEVHSLADRSLTTVHASNNVQSVTSDQHHQTEPQSHPIVSQQSAPLVVGAPALQLTSSSNQTVCAPVLYATVPRSVLAVAGGSLVLPTLFTTGATPAPVATLLVAGADTPKPQTERRFSPGDGGAASPPQPPRHSHNVVERRYRSSINDRLHELRMLVCGHDSDTKMTKSVVLRKAIDHIRFLRQQNRQLRQQLALISRQNLPQQQQQREPTVPRTGAVSPLSGNVTGTVVAPSVDWPSLTTPPYSDSSPSSPDDVPSLPRDVAPDPSVDHLQHPALDVGLPNPLVLTDGARIALCMVLALFVALNPVQRLSSVSGGDDAPDWATFHSVPGRTMLSQSMSERWLPGWLLSVWPLNVALLLLLPLLLVLGEGQLVCGSRRHSLFDRLQRCAQQRPQSIEGDCQLRCLCSALKAAGRKVPSTVPGWAASFSWQLLRQLAHHLPPGRLIMRMTRRLLLSRAERDSLRAVSADCALVYHRLCQMSLCGTVGPSAAPRPAGAVDMSGWWRGVCLALWALNSADLAAGRLSPRQLAPLCATAALLLRQLPVVGGWLARRLLRTSVQQLSSSEAAAARDGSACVELDWLRVAEASRFLLRGDWQIEEPAPSSVQLLPPVVDTDPLLRLRRSFHSFVLCRALTVLTWPGGRVVDESDADLLVRRTHITDVLVDCDLLLQTTVPYHVSGHTECDYDVSVRWWALLAKLVSSSWLQRPRAELSGLHEQLQQLSPALGSEQLVRAGLAMAELMQHEWSVPNERQMMGLLCEATTALEHSVHGASAAARPHDTVQLAQLLIADFVLQMLTQCWQQQQQQVCGNANAAAAAVGQLFARGVACLRQLTGRRPATLSRVFLHEATARLMTSAEPHRTRTLLQRSLRHRRSHHYSSLICGGEAAEHELVGEREHALALMLACCHMPDGLVVSCAGERAGMLAEAAAALRRIGDMRQLTRCRDMMTQIGASSGPWTQCHLAA